MKLKQSIIIASGLALLLGAGCMGAPTVKKPNAQPAVSDWSVPPSGKNPSKLKPATGSGSTSTDSIGGPPHSGRVVDQGTGFQGGPPHGQK